MNSFYRFNLSVIIFVTGCFTICPLLLSLTPARNYFHLPECTRSNSEKFINQKLYDLKRQENFWLRRINLSGHDSISLVINLQDSLISLDLKGVELRACPVMAYRLCDTLIQFRQSGNVPPWFKDILYIKDQYATVPKTPVIIRRIEVGKSVLDDLSHLNRMFDSTEVVLDITVENDLHIRFE